MYGFENGKYYIRRKLIYETLKHISPKHDDLPNLYLGDGDLVFNRANSYELVGKSGSI